MEEQVEKLERSTEIELSEEQTEIFHQNCRIDRTRESSQQEERKID